MSFRRTVMSGGCALAAVAIVGANPAHAWTASLRNSLGASVDDRLVTPMVGRFLPDAGDPFIVDRSQGRTILVRFDGSPEIWVLHPTAGPRGDVIYKNDVGEPVLRSTRVGGFTLFTPENPGGVAAAFAGAAPELGPPPVNSAGELLRSFTQASARVGRAAQRVVSFEARDVPISAAPLFADAAEVVAQAFISIAEGRGGPARPRSLDRWEKVEFVIGRTPGASAEQDALRITLTPDRGLAGRPSSHRIAEVLARRR